MLRHYEGPARVIVGYDGSQDAERALAYGVQEAILHDADLVLANGVDDTVLNSVWGVIFDPEVIRKAAADLLAQAVEDAIELGFPRERLRTDIELGNPAAVLAGHSEQASLIVVGRRSVVDGVRAFVGSTAVGVAGTSHCPVVVVSSDQPVSAERFGLIGVGMHTGAKSSIALEWALEEAERHGGEVVVISVAKAAAGRFFRSGAVAPEVEQQVVDATRQRVADVVGPLAEAHPEVKVTIEASYGNPLDVLVAKSESLDLIVAEVQASFPTYSVGGITRGLMTHSRCPVGTVRTRVAHGS